MPNEKMIELIDKIEIGMPLTKEQLRKKEINLICMLWESAEIAARKKCCEVAVSIGAKVRDFGFAVSCSTPSYVYTWTENIVCALKPDDKLKIYITSSNGIHRPLYALFGMYIQHGKLTPEEAAKRVEERFSGVKIPEKVIKLFIEQSGGKYF